MQTTDTKPVPQGAAPRYVLGLLFNKDYESVVLIRKTKPKWQAGLLNGLSGKIEPGESPLDALAREVREESGAYTRPEQWRKFADLVSEFFTVECFVTVDQLAWQEARTIEAEPIIKLHVEDLRHHYRECVSNLHWLVHMAKDENYGKPFFATIRYEHAK